MERQLGGSLVLLALKKLDEQSPEPHSAETVAAVVAEITKGDPAGVLENIKDALDVGVCYGYVGTCKDCYYLNIEDNIKKYTEENETELAEWPFEIDEMYDGSEENKGTGAVRNIRKKQVAIKKRGKAGNVKPKKAKKKNKIENRKDISKEDQEKQKPEKPTADVKEKQDVRSEKSSEEDDPPNKGSAKDDEDDDEVRSLESELRRLLHQSRRKRSRSRRGRRGRRGGKRRRVRRRR